MDKNFIEDLLYIYVDSMYNMEDYGEALAIISDDIGEDIEDIDDEMSRRLNYIKELSIDEDIYTFFDKMSYIEDSIATEEEILENCKTERAKDLFVNANNKINKTNGLKDL